MTRYLLIFFLLVGCKTPPPDRPYAAPESVTNRAPSDELQTNNLPDLSRSRVFITTNYGETYRFYTNTQQDALIERRDILGPPAVPNYGPFPVYKSPPAVSNWMTAKAQAVEPKPIPNQIPGSTILTRISTTDDKGKRFSAELTLAGNQTIHANDKMALVIFAIYQTNFVVEFCTNLTDGIWHPMSSGVGQDTNSALVIFDLHQGTKPVNFYRRRPTP